MSEQLKKSRFKVPENKVQIHVYIDKDLYKDLIAMAPQLYSKYRGGISYIVEEALRYYLYPRKSGVFRRNPQSTIANVFAKVVERLREYYNGTPKEVVEYDLDHAIMDVRGTDPRTVEKWKILFERSGLIRVVGGRIPRRIYELVGVMGVKD